MRKNILIVSTVARQFYLFEKINIKVLNELEFNIHGAANFKDSNNRIEEVNIVKHHINISRSPFNPLNLIAFFQIIYIIKFNNINVVHCHSPVGGVLGRIAAKISGVKSIIYTAHGFHFFKGASIFNWILFYPIEYLLSLITTDLIVINEEDYNRARFFCCRKLYFLNSIGVDLKKYRQSIDNRSEMRKSLGVDDNTVLIISVGELSTRKNHKLSLDIVSDNYSENIFFVVCGTGKLEEDLQKHVERLKIQKKVSFLGYRNDIAALCMASDIFLSSSKQEGLPISVLEAIASNLPVLCSNVRGNRDVIQDGVNGYLFQNRNDGSLKLKELIGNKGIRDIFKNNGSKIIVEFSNDNVEVFMKDIYTNLNYV